MLHKAWNSKEEMASCFPRSSIKFQGHMGQNITDFDPNWAFPDYRPVAAFKSLRFALLALQDVCNATNYTNKHTVALNCSFLIKSNFEKLKCLYGENSSIPCKEIIMRTSYWSVWVYLLNNRNSVFFTAISIEKWYTVIENIIASILLKQLTSEKYTYFSFPLSYSKNNVSAES